MALKQTKAILRLYNEILEKGITVQEGENIPDIIRKCEEKGQFIFHGDSFWSFVKTTHKERECMRMVFALQAGEGGKVHNIDRITTLISNLESVLVYVDSVTTENVPGFIYVDVIKYL